ncbi:MAG TPA: xanthine dehydrogenase accessory protein XdhC [Burkholderiaceae bacterium]
MMQPAWLTGLCDTEAPAVLVTVAIVEGSGPRAAGAAMAVTAGGQFDTIGGGHLELKACEIARAMLAGGAGLERLQRFPLGPALGQCCGGVTHLAFELIVDRKQLRALQERLRAGQDSIRLIPLATHAPALLLESAGPHADAHRSAHLSNHPLLGRTLATPINPPRNRLYLFGAGHVGAALVQALSALPCHVTWIDEREDLFPAQLPSNVTVELTDAPEDCVEQAPAHAYFLVMTHSHALDQKLAEAILRRPALHWFGLIGSKTKRMLFEHRLASRGVDAPRIARMTCPIGLPGITGKEPAVIAASVCAQLLLAWEADRRDHPSHAASQFTESP